MTPLRTGSDLLACELPELPPRAVDTPTTSATSAAMRRYLIPHPLLRPGLTHRSDNRGDCLKRSKRKLGPGRIAPGCESMSDPVDGSREPQPDEHNIEVVKHNRG
jgi:hypothetical protein